MNLHWDGNNSLVEERNKSAAFGTGTTPPTIDIGAHQAGRGLAARGEAADVSRFRSMPSCRPRAAPSTSSTARSATARAAATSAARTSARSRRLPRSPPIGAGSIRTPPSSPSTSRRSTRATHGASRISARPSATPTCRSTACGCARRICTTDRCRPCATCSSRRRRAPRCSIAATICTTRSASASCRTCARGGRQALLRIRHRASTATRNVGHEGKAYGTELSADDKSALVEFLKTF